MVCVLFSEKYLVVPLDGAVAFRKVGDFKPVTLVERFSLGHHHTCCVNRSRSRCHLCLLSMKYYQAKGRMSRADSPFGKKNLGFVLMRIDFANWRKPVPPNGLQRVLVRVVSEGEMVTVLVWLMMGGRVGGGEGG